jgi:hypothetical protein
MNPTERGFLVLADISGFTEFVTRTELEHGPPIIADLLEVVIHHIAPPLSVQEVEGDAVFALGAERVAPAASLLDALESAFVGFRERQRELAADDTCSCRACRSVDALDLKIVAHHGAFLRQVVGGRGQVAGRDVILAHRLLKNGLPPRSAYLLLTDAAVARMGLTPSAVGLVPHTERYEYLGDVHCFVTEPGVLSARGVC